MGEIDVAVLGAAGGTGRPLIAALVSKGATVAALIHRPEQASTVPQATRTAVVDLANRESLIAALAGTKVAHFIPPVFNAAEEDYLSNVIHAATAIGIERLVYHSVLHAPTPAMPHHARKARNELALRSSALTWTIVQPAIYMQTPLAFYNADAAALCPGFDPKRQFTPIDIVDLSEAVALILTEAGHEFATYELAGPERLDFHDMAAVIARVIGRQVAVRPIASDDLVRMRGAAGGFGPAALVELKAMLDHYDHHGLVGNCNVLRWILRRQPNGFATAAQRQFAPTQS